MKSLLRAGVLATLLLLPVLVFAQNTGSLTLATTVNTDSTLTPKLTWTLTPTATTCTASGDSTWSGAKNPAGGTETLAAFPTTTPKAYALLCTWPGDTQALISWTPPTQNTDGTTLSNLAGFRINYGPSATNLGQTIQIANPGTSSYTVTNLTAGPWFFGLRAYTTQGAESAQSNIVSKTVAGPVEWSQSTGVKVPKAPVLN